MFLVNFMLFLVNYDAVYGAFLHRVTLQNLRPVKTKAGFEAILGNFSVNITFKELTVILN